MTPTVFFFTGMLLIWAVVSGRASAVWSAVTGGTSDTTANTSSGSPVQSVTGTSNAKP